jgi:hypothetical protein
MDNTMLIELTNQKAAGLLHELEELHLIKVLKKNGSTDKPKLSDKYRGVFTKEDSESLNRHIQTMRDEWGSV